MYYLNYGINNHSDNMKYCFVSFRLVKLFFHSIVCSTAEYILRIYSEHCAVSRVKISVRLSYQGSNDLVHCFSDFAAHCSLGRGLKNIY